MASTNHVWLCSKDYFRPSSGKPFTFLDGCRNVGPANCLLCGREAGPESDSSTIGANEIKVDRYRAFHRAGFDSREERGADGFTRQWREVRNARLNASNSEQSDNLSTVSTRNDRQHVYTPISHGGKMIRLFSLEPGPPSSPIVGQLIDAELGSEDQPAYEALSYTWADESGNREYSTRIWCNTGYLPVTENGEALLRRVRMRTKSRLVWMDQLCINQSNLSERSQQVGLMPEIFGNASQVLIYLGSSPILDDLLPTLHNDALHDRYFLQSERCQSLLRLPWFNRVWVLQEAARARKAVMLGPNSCFSFDKIQSASKSAHLRTGYGMRSMDSLPGALSIEPRKPVPATEILELLNRTNTCFATDPRDKVFALFGMIDSTQDHGLIADYNKTTAEVYTEITLYIINSSRKLDVLAYCSREGNGLSLPSWVPDWSTKLPKPLIKYVKQYIAMNTWQLRLHPQNLAVPCLFGSNNIQVRGCHLTSVQSRWKTSINGNLSKWCEKCLEAGFWTSCAHAAMKVGAEAYYTENGPAFGVKEIHDGDQIWDLDGAEQLFALRKHENTFKVVGECFLLGFTPDVSYSGHQLFCDHKVPYHGREAQEIELC